MKYIALSILIGFLVISIFSFAAMTYGTDGRMQGDCPFSAMGASLCPQDALTLVLHHFSAYQSFFSAPILYGITYFIISLLLVAGAIFVFLKSLPLFMPAAFAGNIDNSPPYTSTGKKILRWLSLFENSPSIS